MSIIGLIIGFDFGTKNIGVAIGQKLTYTVQPLTVLQSKHGSPDWKAIESIYQVWQPNILVVGLPLKQDGSEQPITILAKKFASQLQDKLHVTVKLHDERFSTSEARQDYLKYFYNNNNPRYQQDIKINAIAAGIILKSWLNKFKMKYKRHTIKINDTP